MKGASIPRFCVVASVLLSPNQKASNSVRFDYLGSFQFTITPSLYRRCTNTDNLNTSTYNITMYDTCIAQVHVHSNWRLDLLLTMIL